MNVQTYPQYPVFQAAKHTLGRRGQVLDAYVGEQETRIVVDTKANAQYLAKHMPFKDKTAAIFECDGLPYWVVVYTGSRVDIGSDNKYSVFCKLI